MKGRKQDTIDADLSLQKFEHDSQVIAKERAAALNAVSNLEKQYSWISDESE
jgi:hypothetical protein